MIGIKSSGIKHAFMVYRKFTTLYWTLNPGSLEHQLNFCLNFLYLIAVHLMEQCSRLISWDPNILIRTLHHTPVSGVSVFFTAYHIAIMLCFLFIYNVARCWYCCPYRPANFKNKFIFIILLNKSILLIKLTFPRSKIARSRNAVTMSKLFFLLLFFLYFKFWLKNDRHNAFCEDILRIYKEWLLRTLRFQSNIMS